MEMLSVTRKAPSTATEMLTLSDADITSRRVTRRTLLGALGLGAGVATAATLGVTDIASADSGDAKEKKAPPKKPAGKKAAPKKKTEETDSD